MSFAEVPLEAPGVGENGNPKKTQRGRGAARAIVGLLALAVLGLLIAGSVQVVSEAQLRTSIHCSLKQMALGMIYYSDNNDGRLPPGIVYSKDGKPLYSWRVALLPYIEQNQLYREFKLDEPWDSPHNLQLLPRMPPTYAGCSKWSQGHPGYTFFRVFVGKGTPFEDPRGNFLKDITDGTSNTILIVVAGEAVPWTKPDELAYAPDLPLPPLGGLSRRSSVFHAAMGDGSSRSVPRTVSETTLRGLITRNGGEILGPDW
jgi:hypothetical protein